MHDHDALRHLDFVQHLCDAGSMTWPDLDKVHQFVRQRKLGQVRHHVASLSISMSLLPMRSPCYWPGGKTGFPGQILDLTLQGVCRWITLLCSR